MSKTLRTLFLLLALGFAATALSACNLFEGAGEDVEAVGEDIEEAAESAGDEIDD